MEILEAVTRLAARQDRSAFPIDATFADGMDVWPEATAAAASLSGRLDDAATDDDIDAALRTFEALYGDLEDGNDDAPITPADWRAETEAVMRAILQRVLDDQQRQRVARPGGDFSLN